MPSAKNPLGGLLRMTLLSGRVRWPVVGERPALTIHKIVEHIFGVALGLVMPQQQHPYERADEHGQRKYQRRHTDAQHKREDEVKRECDNESHEDVDEIVAFEPERTALAIIDAVRVGDPQFAHGRTSR